MWFSSSPKKTSFWADASAQYWIDTLSECKKIIGQKEWQISWIGSSAVIVWIDLFSRWQYYKGHFSAWGTQPGLDFVIIPVTYIYFMLIDVTEKTKPKQNWYNHLAPCFLQNTIQEMAPCDFWHQNWMTRTYLFKRHPLTKKIIES